MGHKYGYIEIKNNVSVSKKGIAVKIFGGITFTFFLTIFSVTVYSNIFFAVPTYVKMLTLLGTSFLFINIVFDKAEAILYWKDSEKRPVILNIKMKQSFIETIVVFFVNFIIIILSQFLGLLNFIYEREGMKYFIFYEGKVFFIRWKRNPGKSRFCYTCSSKCKSYN